MALAHVAYPREVQERIRSNCTVGRHVLGRIPHTSRDNGVLRGDCLCVFLGLFAVDRT